jgi:hypothetical protein
VLAIESLTAIADSLKAAKPALLAQLGPAGMSKEVEGYFSRTVDAALDLRDAIDRGGARQLLAVSGLAAHAAAAWGLANAVAVGVGSAWSCVLSSSALSTVGHAMYVASLPCCVAGVGGGGP